MKVALYLRVSTDDRGQTVESQRLPLMEFCKAQGWTEAAEYADEASATDLRGRKAWRRLLEDASRRKIDVLLVLATRPHGALGARRGPDLGALAGLGGGAAKLPGAVPGHHVAVRRGTVLHHDGLRAVGARHPLGAHEGRDG